MSIKEKLKKFWNENRDDIIFYGVIGFSAAAATLIGVGVGKYIGFYNGAAAITDYTKSLMIKPGSCDYFHAQCINADNFKRCTASERSVMLACISDIQETVRVAAQNTQTQIVTQTTV